MMKILKKIACNISYYDKIVSKQKLVQKKNNFSTDDAMYVL